MSSPPLSSLLPSPSSTTFFNPNYLHVSHLIVSVPLLMYSNPLLLPSRASHHPQSSSRYKKADLFVFVYISICSFSLSSIPLFFPLLCTFCYRIFHLLSSVSWPLFFLPFLELPYGVAQHLQEKLLFLHQHI